VRAGFEVEEHQRPRLDPDPNSAAGEDFGGQDHLAAQGGDAAAADGPVDLDRGSVFDRWHG
jgi:hypothetical protein